MTSTAEAKTAKAVAECTKRLETFQQRMITYIKKVDEDVQEPMKVLSLQLRDLKVQDKRQGMLIHQSLNDLVALRHALDDLGGLKAQESRRVLALENKISKVLGILETSIGKAEVDCLLERMEKNMKLRLEAMQEHWK
uniref:Uncharacterized protein n=1 Tax=Globisporangium ultimum (strain ATCC 200006 / CBS 805.95 / DAOM BR144) TaxID=431595 RepID=K3WP31_GLOUD